MGMSVEIYFLHAKITALISGALDLTAISPVWKKLGDLIENYLDSVTIEQLMGDPETTLSATEALR